jgi:hypothetical protein
VIDRVVVRVILACALAGCAGGLSPAESQAEATRMQEGARREGARVRAAFPVCRDTAVPEGAERVEGIVVRGSLRVCTDAGCSPHRPHCNTCELNPHIRPDDRTQKEVAITLMGRALKVFGSFDLPSVADGAWWEGFGRTRVRMTFIPGAARDIVELCRVADDR